MTRSGHLKKHFFLLSSSCIYLFSIVEEGESYSYSLEVAMETCKHKEEVMENCRRMEEEGEICTHREFPDRFKSVLYLSTTRGEVVI